MSATVTTDYLVRKDDFIAQLRTTALALMPEHTERSCLLYSAVGVALLKRMGIRALVQAGSAAFRYKAEALDDGGSTHYSYVFNLEDPLSKARMDLGGLPEMHCWIGVPSTKELIDATTGFLPSLLRQALNEPWTAPQPPDFFWGTREAIPEGWRYYCERQATVIALACIARRWPDLFSEVMQSAAHEHVS